MCDQCHKEEREHMQASELIARIKQYYGVPDIDLAYECDVTREHINRVLHGHKRANAELLERLESILEYCREVRYQPTRKPYTRRVVSNKEPIADRPKAVQTTRRETLPDRPKAVQAARREILPEVSSPAMARPGKHLCQSCQSGKGTAFYHVLNNWFCRECAKVYGQVLIG